MTQQSSPELWGRLLFSALSSELLVYGPRDHAELALVLDIIHESLAFARSRN